MTGRMGQGGVANVRSPVGKKLRALGGGEALDLAVVILYKLAQLTRRGGRT